MVRPYGVGLAPARHLKIGWLGYMLVVKAEPLASQSN